MNILRSPVYLCLLLCSSMPLALVTEASTKVQKQESVASPATDKSDEEESVSEWELLYEKELAQLNFEKAKLEHRKEMLELEYAIQEAEEQKVLATVESEKRRLSLENELTEQLVRREELKKALHKISSDYLLDPFQQQQLFISDRRIALNGNIVAETADEITRYIHYYNNQNTEYPIFLVIDRCLGGSVMEGARIVEAMRNSKAPVYVVVKSVTASMGAVITALAERSFAYPNAIFVHHQMMTAFYGNSTQAEERLKISEEWSERLMKPVAEKMGMNLEGFVKAMYQHNTEGNWIEFANQAQKLGWVDHIVPSIRETSYIDAPETEDESSGDGDTEVVLLKAHLLEKKGLSTAANKKLPALAPGDFYHLYDPQGIYQK